MVGPFLEGGNEKGAQRAFREAAKFVSSSGAGDMGMFTL